MITTTLNKIREYLPCQSGWEKLLKHLGKTQADDEPLPLAVILESNGLQDAIWATRTIWDDHRKEMILMTLKFARTVQPLMKDRRSIDALDTIYRFVNGEASQEDIEAAAWAARAAAEAAAEAAAWAAAWAARAAAEAAAEAAAWAAARAARAAAEAAAEAAAWAAARAAKEKELTAIFLEVMS